MATPVTLDLDRQQVGRSRSWQVPQPLLVFTADTRRRVTTPEHNASSVSVGSWE